MQEFLHDVAKYPFLQYAILAGALASVSCGVVGSYVVVRRGTYIAGAISHTVLGGMGAARYLQVVHEIEWMTPFLGALIAAVAAAFIMGLVTLYAREREDTVLSAMWAIGMATGISFIAVTPGNSGDLMSYLFGNILMVGQRDVWMMAGLDLAVVLVTFLFYGKFLTICFHEEFARLRGLRVGLYHMLLLLMTSLTVVLLVQVVGIVLAIALLTLPAATASLLTRRLWHSMILAVVLSLLFTLGGLALSYGPELPPGATIVELAGAVYLATLIGKHAVAWARRRLLRNTQSL